MAVTSYTQRLIARNNRTLPSTIILFRIHTLCAYTTLHKYFHFELNEHAIASALETFLRLEYGEIKAEENPSFYSDQKYASYRPYAFS